MSKRLSLLPLIALVILAGCGGSSSPTNPNQSSQPAYVEGLVFAGPGYAYAQSDSGAISGASVTLAEINTDGTLQTVSTAPVQTASDGTFRVAASVTGKSHLFAVAVRNTSTWRTVVSGTVEPGTTVLTQPLNDVSTTQADVYSQIVADGLGSSVSYSDAVLAVDSGLAAQIRGDAASIGQVAKALEDQADARSTFLADSTVGLSSTQIQQIETARAAAQTQFDAALNAAGTSTAAIQAALAAHEAADQAAFTNGGVRPHLFALAVEVGARRLRRSALLLGAQAQFRLLQLRARARAEAIEAVITAEFTALGAPSDVMNTLATAGTTLLTSISQAQNEAEILAAFSAYHLVVLQELKAVLNQNAVDLDALESNIGEVGGPKATLTSSADGATSSSQLASAYATFYRTVRSSVVGRLASLGATDIDAVAALLTVLDMIY